MNEPHAEDNWPTASSDRGLAEAFGPPTGPRDSILGRLVETVGSMPRVLLRDTEPPTNPGQVVQVGSAEMPTLGVRSPRLQLLGEIGRGGMGAVLKGRDTDLGRDLAVKVLREDHRGRPELVRRFVEEAQIAGQLQHPGVVPVYELGCFTDARPFFTMKLVKGLTLAQLLNDRPAAGAERRFLGIFEAVCQTVAYAHARGVIHRDLKPSNIMVGGFGEVQVMDWGLAKVLPRGGAADDAAAGRTEKPVQETVIATARSESDSDLSQAGSVLGTPSYMAPEQARGEGGAVDERADVFALGSILCEILTGAPAFTGRTSGEIQRNAARGELGDASARLSACAADGELVALAHECLAAEADDRPHDAGIVTGRLTAYLAGVQERLRAAELAQAAEAARAAEALRTAEMAEARTRAERQAHRLTAALAAVVVGLMALGGAGAAWLQHQRAERSAAIARAVEKTLDEALRLEAVAQAAAVDDPVPWDKALAEARHAADQLGPEEAVPLLRDRVAAQISTFITARDRAARRAADRQVLADLLAARVGSGIFIGTVRSRAYSAAFGKAGLEVDKSEPETVGAWIASRSSPSEMAAYLDDWANVRRQMTLAPGQRPWTHFIASARKADPDPWRDRLRAGLLGDHEALRAAADDELALSAQPVVSLNLLAIYLANWAKDLKRAERVLRLNWRSHPEDYWVNCELATVIGMVADSSPERRVDLLHEKLRFLTAGLAARPNAMIYDALGNTLWELKRIDEAKVAFHEALVRAPDRLEARSQFGRILMDTGETERGLALIREAAARPGAGPVELFYLGAAMDQLGRAEKAVAAYREAVRLDDAHSGAAIFNLGFVLRNMGRYDEAVETHRRARDLSEAEGRPDLTKALEREIEQTLRFKAFEPRLPAILRGDNRLRDRAELADLVRFCRDRRLYAAGTRLNELAFRDDPGLDSDTMSPHRWEAGLLAALAGCQPGFDDPPPDDALRAHFRDLGLHWLKAELASNARHLAAAPAQNGPSVAGWMRNWRAHPDLSGVREPGALRSLPEPERDGWQALWGEVAAVLAKALKATQ